MAGAFHFRNPGSPTSSLPVVPGEVRAVVVDMSSVRNATAGANPPVHEKTTPLPTEWNGPSFPVPFAGEPAAR